MSALVHCDGPGCDKTKSTTFEDRRIGEPGWSMLEQRDRNYDFHSAECLANWVNGVSDDRCGVTFHMEIGGRTVVCNQRKGHDGPHARATATTVVNGR